MSRVHYFQRYAQKENVATNNTLLLLSRLYSYNPTRLNVLLNDILEDTQTIEVGVSFRQQEKARRPSVPDGTLSQTSFTITIETKIEQKSFDENQLTNHLSSFPKEGTKILLLLSRERPSPQFAQRINRAVDHYNKEHGTNIFAATTTFEDIIATFTESLSERDYDMVELVEDYETFCSTLGLLPDDKYKLRVMAAGWSLEDNVRHGVYFDEAPRGYQKHAYLGLYKEKSVRYIGAVTNVVCANVDDVTLSITEADREPTPQERDRISGIILAIKKRVNIDVSRGYRFFLVDHFVDTDLRKTTKNPIWRAKYFDLKCFVGAELPSLEKIAQQLREKTW